MASLADYAPTADRSILSPMCRGNGTGIDHYARMALEEGSVDHARYQVKEMENHPTGLFKGLGKAVAQCMKEINESSQSGS